MNNWRIPDTYKLQPYELDHPHYGLTGGKKLVADVTYFNTQSLRTHYHAPELREKYQYNPDTGLITFRPSPTLRAEQAQRWRAVAPNSPHLDFEEFLTGAHLTMRPLKSKKATDYTSPHQFRVFLTLGPTSGLRRPQRLRYGWIAFMLTHPTAPPSLPMEVRLKSMRGSDGTAYTRVDVPALYWWDNLEFKLNENYMKMESDVRDGDYLHYRRRMVYADTGEFFGYAEHYDNDYGKWLGMLK